MVQGNHVIDMNDVIYVIDVNDVTDVIDVSHVNGMVALPSPRAKKTSAYLLGLPTYLLSLPS